MLSISRAALLLTAALIASASGAAQVDVAGALGGAVTASGESPVSDGTALGVVSVSVAPGLPRGVRVAASVTVGPGDDEGYAGTIAALGAGVEIPLTGGRNGVYFALGGALLDFDNREPGLSGCDLDPDCLDESGAADSYAGLAATVGLGARIPVARQVWIEPSVSAFIWGSGALPSARIGVGWRIR